MTATRKAATIVAACAAWFVCAWLLWRTEVPATLRLRALRPQALFPARELARARRHDTVLDWLWVAATLVQLVVLALLGRTGVAPVLRGPRLLRCALAAAAAVGAATLAPLPLDVVAHWWQRRYAISHEAYLPWLLDWLRASWPTVALAAAAGFVLALLASRLRRTWWVGGAAAVVALGAAAVTVAPLLAPGGTYVLARGTVRSDLVRLARAEHVALPKVVVERASARTTLANAEAVGLGPTERVVIWDTMLNGRFSRAELRFVGAHELAHFQRRHLLKGLGWLALIALPATWLLSRLADPSDPRRVPRAVLIVVAISLAVLPLSNAVSRRYEQEADWIALATTRDPGAGRALFRRFALIGLSDPDPPGWAHVLLDDHPTYLQRIELAAAYARAR